MIACAAIFYPTIEEPATQKELKELVSESYIETGVDRWLGPRLVVCVAVHRVWLPRLKGQVPADHLGRVLQRIFGSSRAA